MQPKNSKEVEIQLSICNLDKTGLFMSVFQLGSYGVAPKVVVAPEMWRRTEERLPTEFLSWDH